MTESPTFPTPEHWQHAFDVAFPVGATVVWAEDYIFHVPRVMVANSNVADDTVTVRLLPMEQEGMLYDVSCEAPDVPIPDPVTLHDSDDSLPEGVMKLSSNFPADWEEERQHLLLSDWFRTADQVDPSVRLPEVGNA